MTWAIPLLAALCGLAATMGPRVADAAATYTNPVGNGVEMGDPYVVKYGDTYYLTGTTTPGSGFKMWTSKNLVDWAPVGTVFQKDAGTWGKSNFWAAELFTYRGKYYLAYSVGGPVQTQEKPEFRLCLAVADQPTGPYHDLYAPWCDQGYACIDADVLIDKGGTPYVYFAKVGVRQKPTFKLLATIYGARLKDDLSGIVGEPTLCAEPVQPWETPEAGRSLCNEGPGVFEHGGRYYMTYSANHYAEPFYGIGYATAPAPLGPWKKPEDSRLLVADPALGVSGPGHNSVTTSPDGSELFIVYHAHRDPSRPNGARTVNIDRLVVQDDGTLKVLGPTRSPQPMPAGAQGDR